MTKVVILQLGHNLLIVDRYRILKEASYLRSPSIGPQSFDCGQNISLGFGYHTTIAFNWATIF